jgi:hypothetical protein
MADRELKKVEQELDAAIRDALKDDPEGSKPTRTRRPGARPRPKEKRRREM